MNSAVAAEIYAPAARAALSEFLIDVAALELVSVSENVTFRLTDRRSGAAFVLRLHRPGYHTLAELEAERVWIRALADAGVAVPGPVTARNGREYIQVHIPGADEQRYVGVSEWTDGELLADVLQRDDRAEVFDQSFTALGALTATLHNQAGNWRVPANFSRHAVDEDGLLGEAPFWGRFWEHPLLSATQRQQLLATREQLRAALRRYGCAASTYSIIHADLHPGNVLINGDR